MCGVVGHPLAAALQQQQQQQQQQDCDVHGPRKPSVAPLDASPASNIHVLVVDDERLTRMVLSGLLMKCGYRVTSASDGAEALRLLRSSAPDTFQLVLTDVCMPEVNGIELLSQVKADANLRAVPVVMMSSVDQEETVAECVQYGAEEYLVKPVTKKEVQHIWQHVWRKRCAGATVPQLPPEAAAAMAAVAAAAATQQTHSEQQQQQEAVLPAQDVQQPAEPSVQQAQQAASGASVEQLILSGPAAAGAGLQERQRVFTAAVDMVQASHLQKQALLCLRPSRLQVSQQGLAEQQESAASSSTCCEADALYCSPEEAAGQGGCPSDMFSLGLLFLDLFFPCGSQEERLAQLRAAHSGALPAVLSGAHTAGAAQALQDLVRGLLQADPAARPSVHAVLRAGLADPFSQVEQLPHWRLASTQQPAQQAAAQQAQQPPAAEAAAAATQPLALGGAVVAVDHDAVRHFLLLLRKSKQQEVAAAQAQLAALETDIGETVRRRSGSDAASSCPAGGAATADQPAAKRQRCGSGPAELGAEVAVEARQRLAEALPRLEEVYFQRRGAVQAAAAQHAQSAGPGEAAAAGEGSTKGAAAPQAAHLEPFAADLQRLAARSRLGLKAALRCGDIASPTEMACCAAFDRDDEFFATVGVSRRVKIFDFRACLEGRRGGALHYPALQITTRSKLSSVSWNHYVKSQLITSDYGGLIQLWDASTAGEAAQFDEHARRVWSVDFSTTDPMRFLSGSDDGSVRLWSVHDSGSVARIQAPANVCSVQFSPADGHTVAFGCANYRVYLYDLRHTAAPLAVASGPQRAVSYVRFLGGSHLVSASTDSTLRLWDLRDLVSSGSAAAPCLSGATATSLSGCTNDSGAGAAAAGRTRPACTYTGHRNQRNFVGLSVSPSGHILCGSEDNSVYSYYRSLPFPTASYQFPDAAGSGPAGGSSGGSGGAHQPFVSAVCWANNSRHCLAANSQGLLQILELE